MRWPVICQSNGCYCQLDTFNQTAEQIILFETQHVGTPQAEAEAMIASADAAYPAAWNEMLEDFTERYGRDVTERFNRCHSYL